MSAPAAAGASPGAAGTHNYQFDIHSPAGGYADPNDVLAQAEQQFRARGGRAPFHRLISPVGPY